MPPHKPEDLHQIVPATLWAIYWLDVAQIYDYVLYISLQWDFEYHHTSETQGFLSQGLYFYFTVTEMRRPAYIEVNGLKVLVTFSLKHRVKVAKLPLHLLLLLKVHDGNKVLQLSAKSPWHLSHITAKGLWLSEELTVTNSSPAV